MIVRRDNRYEILVQDQRVLVRSRSKVSDKQLVASLPLERGPALLHKVNVLMNMPGPISRTVDGVTVRKDRMFEIEGERLLRLPYANIQAFCQRLSTVLDLALPQEEHECNGHQIPYGLVA